jgi:hypothetical protein
MLLQEGGGDFMVKLLRKGQKINQQKPKILVGDSNHVIRRSITVEDNLNTFLNVLRARYLEHHGLEIDFTTMINAMAAMAARRFSAQEMTDADWEVFNSYLSFDDLHLEGAKDEWENKWLEYQLPKFELHPKKDIESNSVSKKKKDDVPEQEQPA